MDGWVLFGVITVETSYFETGGFDSEECRGGMSLLCSKEEWGSNVGHVKLIVEHNARILPMGIYLTQSPILSHLQFHLHSTPSSIQWAKNSPRLHWDLSCTKVKHCNAVYAEAYGSAVFWAITMIAIVIIAWLGKLSLQDLTFMTFIGWPEMNWQKTVKMKQF